MTFKFRYYDKIVGFFVLIGLLCLLLVVLLMASNQRWFEGSLPLFTVFNRGEDLASGMDVKLNGITVGKATRIALNEENRIRVDFKIYNQFRDRVKSDASILLETPSPLGGGYLSIALKKTDGTHAEATEGQWLHSQDEDDVKKLLNAGNIERIGGINSIIQDIASLVSTLMAPDSSLNATLDNLKIVTDDIADKGISKALSLEDTISGINKLLSDLNVLSATLRSSSPQIKNIIDTAQRSLSDASGILTGLQDFLGTAPGRNTDPETGIGMIQHNQRGYQY
ncbi:MAG: MlaD family protein [Spirochaetota bacterium]|jgi:phospholipid/cholesterol/gamma-HCH transport system substrate-binding protein|nr:MlaD family protein [Spirochaetota bacterium]